MRSKSFIFLGDVLEMESKNGIALFDSYKLKRASKTQITYIKKYIDAYSSALSFNINRYEHSSKPIKNGGQSFIRLEEQDWNYCVIEHANLHMNQSFPAVLGLSRLDLTVLFEGIYGIAFTHTGKESAAIMSRELTTANFFHDKRLHRAMNKRISTEDIKELREIYYLMQQFDRVKDVYDFIAKAIGDFMRLEDISEQSPFKIMGYFSILELLLTTYRPRSSNDSSLSNQLQKKINLLNNRFDRRIEIADHFKGADTNTIETIVGKLYQYRNDIAHGNKSDFERELRILNGKRDNIIDFLRILLKSTLIHALKEPQLMKDLKEC